MSDDPWEEEDEDLPPPKAPPPAQPYQLSLSAKAVEKLNEQTNAPPQAKMKGTIPLPHVSLGKSGGTGELTADDIDEDTIIGPSVGFVNRSYAGSAKMSPRHLAIAESAARDGLALQSAGKRDALTASFARQGINWNAGYASSLEQTPVGHAIAPEPLPEPGQALQQDTPQKKGQLVVYTVNPHLQIVLEVLLPPAFKNAMIQARGLRSNLRQLCIYYLPLAQGTSAGFIHEFTSPKDASKRFYLYIQTSVGNAPVAILDDVLGSLQDGLPEGENAEDWTVEPERRRSLHKIGQEVEHSFQKVSESFSESVPFKAMGESLHRVKDIGSEVSHGLDKVDDAVGKYWKKAKRWFGLR